MGRGGAGVIPHVSGLPPTIPPSAKNNPLLPTKGALQSRAQPAVVTPPPPVLRNNIMMGGGGRVLAGAVSPSRLPMADYGDDSEEDGGGFYSSSSSDAAPSAGGGGGRGGYNNPSTSPSLPKGVVVSGGGGGGGWDKGTGGVGAVKAYKGEDIHVIFDDEEEVGEYGSSIESGTASEADDDYYSR